MILLVQLQQSPSVDKNKVTHMMQLMKLKKKE